VILLRSFVACGLVVSLLLPVSTAEAAKKKKKTGRPINGTVTSVEASASDKNTGTLAVKVHQHKKKGAAAPAEEAAKSFTFTKDTKVVKIVGKKKDRTEEQASMADVKSGSRIMVQADTNGKAEKVMVLAGKKGKKKQS